MIDFVSEGPVTTSSTDILEDHNKIKFYKLNLEEVITILQVLRDFNDVEIIMGTTSLTGYYVIVISNTYMVLRKILSILDTHDIFNNNEKAVPDVVMADPLGDLLI